MLKTEHATTEGVNHELERLLDHLRLSRGFDLSAYKRSSLLRRVQKRMQQTACANCEDYLNYLEVHADEFAHLFNTILINVTSFFRDVEAWDYLRNEVMPQILSQKGINEPIRIWVAGCASGQEAYSITMLLAEQIGWQAFRDRVKIYATDVDEEALAQCRVATYTARELEAVPAELIDKYFERVNDRLVFERDLRRSMIIGRHDLVQDAPISRIDLLTCRNTLMYFNAEAQDKILARFHFALNDGGYLFLGKAETLLTHTNLFVPVDLKNRMFMKVPRSRIRDRSFMFLPTNGDGAKDASDGLSKLRELAVDAAPIAQIVLDAGDRLVMVNERARALFGVYTHDMGRPFRELDLSFRPVELRSCIEEAGTQRRVVQHKDVAWMTLTGESVVLDVRVVPLLSDANEPIGTAITFDDVTQYKHLEDELLNFNQELETAYEEVQSTNEELQTTNEELQSTVEELETTNEELQSTNEELETMNEELQSTNEELETMNEELRQRSDELNRSKGFLESILASLRDGVIVVDENLEILAWNSGSEELWGLHANEVIGRHLLNLDIGLKANELRDPIRRCLSANEYLTKELFTTNRRGKQLLCALSFNPLLGPASEVLGVILLCSASSVTAGNE